MIARRRWWCVDCRRISAEDPCAVCGHGSAERRSRCDACGATNHRAATTCSSCNAAITPRSGLRWHAAPRTAYSGDSITGTFVAERAHGAERAGLGVEYAPVRRGLPWLDLLTFATVFGIVGGIFGEWLGGNAMVALLLTASLILLVAGTLRRAMPSRFQALANLWRRRFPTVRRIIVLLDGTAQPVAIEIHHPNRWPPMAPLTAAPTPPVATPQRRGERPRQPAPFRVRCEGRWLEERVLLRADRITVLGAGDRAGWPPILATAHQTLAMALGLVGLGLIAGAAMLALAQ